MKTPRDAGLESTENETLLSEEVSMNVLGNGQYDVRLRIAGVDKSQLIRVPAHGQVTLTGPSGSYVFDAISRRLLFQLDCSANQAPRALADFY